MTAIQRYHEAVARQLDTAFRAQSDALERAATVIATALQNDRFVYAFGTGHSHMLAEEIFYRAGGLARASAIFDPPLMLHEGAAESSRIEQQTGHAEGILSRYPIDTGDVLIIASNSGRNAVPVEMALAARARGVRTIAVTSLAHSTAFPSRHASGKRLFEVADLVVDHGSPPGDASVEIPGLPRRTGATSTVVGAALLNALVARAIELCVEARHIPDVYASSNADVPGWNESLIAKYRGRIRHL